MSERGWWPARHEQYEEWCSLAAAGLLDGPELDELNAHVAGCDSCRDFLRSVAEVSVQLGPVLHEGSQLPDQSAAAGDPEGMRARFLTHLEEEQPPSAWNAPLVLVPSPKVRRPTALRWTGRIAVGLAASLALVAFGFLLGARGTTPAPSIVIPAAAVPLPTSAAPVRQIDQAVPPTEFRLELARLNQLLQDAREQSRIAEAIQADLQRRGSVSEAKLTSALEQAREKDLHAQRELQAAKSAAVNLQAQVGQLEERIAAYGNRMASQLRATAELANQLESTEAALRRSRALEDTKARLGDVLAARNLHIVDVYDADGNGRRRAAVGRVFYIEGASLVFYAYDLDRPPGRFKSQVAFHVWGGQTGGKGATHNLGILRKESSGENCWTLTFDDPKVLAQINTVFVTAEPLARNSTAPAGKKILFAYFGTPPNHPGEAVNQ